MDSKDPNILTKLAKVVVIVTKGGSNLLSASKLLFRLSKVRSHVYSIRGGMNNRNFILKSGALPVVTAWIRAFSRLERQIGQNDGSVATAEESAGRFRKMEEHITSFLTQAIGHDCLALAAYSRIRSAVAQSRHCV
eukprot:753295-Hanusia_phi.AAC.7